MNADKTEIRTDTSSIVEEPRIIYEDENFVAVDKPAGMLTHAVRVSANNNQREPATVTDWLLKKYSEMKHVGDEPEIRPGIVHRLDKETSGILLAAKNQKYFEYLKSLFKTRQIKKTYCAIVLGAFKEKTGIIDKAIRRAPGSVKRTVFPARQRPEPQALAGGSGTMEKRAITRYNVKKIFADPNGETFSLLEVVPETGRTHQIRVHLASIGHPIVGDRLYGPKHQPVFTAVPAVAKALATAGRRAGVHPSKLFDGKSRRTNRLMLHARSLEFLTAEGTRLKLEVEPPQDFVNQFLVT